MCYMGVTLFLVSPLTSGGSAARLFFALYQVLLVAGAFLIVGARLRAGEAMVRPVGV